MPRGRETKSANSSRFFADPIGVPCRRRRRPSMPPASGQSHGAQCAPWDCPRAAFSAVRCQPRGGGTPSAASAMPQPSAGKLKQSCFSLLSPCAPWTPITLHNFETIHTRSLVIMPRAHPIMFHVLTGPPCIFGKYVKISRKPLWGADPGVLGGCQEVLKIEKNVIFWSGTAVAGGRSGRYLC